jgi:DNA invertase Pin-like site-specific DNA recombinase
MKHSAKPAAKSIDHGRFGYARVSTRGQTLEVQLAALAAAAVAPASVFAEKKSGRAGSARPQWEDVRSRLRPGDTLVVSKLDRMGRDMREIMETAWSLQDLGAKLEILSGPLAGVYDPRGMGKIFFAMLAGFAEMEREMMIERTNDGLGHDPAQDPAVGPAGAGLLGSAQGGQVGAGGLAERDGGNGGDAADGCHTREPYQR